MSVVWDDAGEFARDAIPSPVFSDDAGAGCAQTSMQFTPGATYHIVCAITQNTPGSKAYSSHWILTADNVEPVPNGSKPIDVACTAWGGNTTADFYVQVAATPNGGGSYDIDFLPGGVYSNASVGSGMTHPAVAVGVDYYVYYGGADQHHGSGVKTPMEWTITDDVVAPTPDPEPEPPGGVIIDDDGFTPVAELTASDIEDMKVRIELQGTGSGLAKINRHNAVADEDNIKKGNWLAFMIPQIQDDAIFLTQIETLTTTVISTDEEGGEVINIAGRGALSYMERGRGHARSYVVPGGLDYDGILHGPASTGNEVGQILNRMLAEFQHVDRGVTDFGRRLQPIAHLTHDFDYDTDSDGNAWTVTQQTAELSAGYVGQTGLESCLNMIGTNAIDIQVWPNMAMQAFNEYGRDLTGAAFGTGVVRFVKGVNIAEKLDRQFAAPVDPTDTIVKGQDGAYGFASHPLAGTVPDVEGFVSTFGTDPAALEAIGLADMARRIRQGESVQFRVTVPRFGTDPDESIGLYLPGPPDDRPTTHTYSNGNYWVGDTVTLSTGTGFHDFEDVDARIMAITIEIDEAGDLDVTVELKATTIVGRFPTTGTAANFGVTPAASPGGTGGGSPPPPPSGWTSDTHVSDATDAHDASAISVLDTGANYAATNVETALAEVMDEVQGHEADASDAHDASAISVVPFSTIAATDVQAALEEIVAEATGGGSITVKDEGTPLATAASSFDFVGAGVTATGATGDKTITIPGSAAHEADATDAHDASAISIVDSGNYFTGADVEAALQELGAGGGGTVDVEDESSPEGAADTLDFVGAGVSVSFAGGTATIDIPGATPPSPQDAAAARVFAAQTFR